MYHPRIEYPPSEKAVPAAPARTVVGEAPAAALPTRALPERSIRPNGAHPEDATVPGAL
jgi:hypothetical protein